ncbi:RVP_2 domain-containing protein, partial [Cephalotus follicularis]
HKVTVLIDTDNTHNFLNHNLAKKLDLKPDCEGKFEVAVANGEKLTSEGQCKAICMKMKGVPLKIDFYLLPLEGSDVVLGAQWLSTLGPIWWDFSKLQMSFQIDGKDVVLHELKTAENKVVDEAQISKEVKKEKKGIFLQINALTMSTVQPNNLVSNDSFDVSNEDLGYLLQNYSYLFKEPQRFLP